MSWLTLEAYAKVNLGLAVLARRTDGYHDIDTIFQTVSLCDNIRIEAPSARPVIRVTGLDVAAGRDNLAFRAVEALQELTGCPPVTVSLDKRIPVAAGLGGGSSDAAAVLNGVNALLDLNLSQEELERLALTLGSDVPFLVAGGTARGEGRGERLSRLHAIPDLWFVIVTVPVAVTAALGYERARIGLTESEALIRLSCSAIQRGDAESLTASLHNDMEAGVVSYCPDVAVARSALAEAGARVVVMSGSGPSLLGLAANEQEAREVASRLEGRDLVIHIARPVATGSRITARGEE